LHSQFNTDVGLFENCLLRGHVATSCDRIRSGAAAMRQTKRCERDFTVFEESRNHDWQHYERYRV